MGNLLSPREALTGPSAGAATKPGDVRDLGPGLRVLILKKGGVEAQQLPNSRASFRGCGAAKISLLAADLAIAGLVVLWQTTSNTPMQFWEATACVGCIVLAAWLGLLAAWLHFRAD